MNLFQDNQYSLTKVTAVAIDPTNAPNNYLWVAFAQNSSGNCILKKVSVNNPSQVYYTISVPVTAITGMVILNSQIFLAVTPQLTGNYTQAFCWAYSVTNPLTSWTYINTPSGVTESPIGITTDGTNAYLLTPGLNTNNSTIVSVSNGNVWNENIVLNPNSMNIHNAGSITSDASGNLWVVTTTGPTYLIRAWKPVSTWQFEATQLLG